jgi:hypothetical protein
VTISCLVIGRLEGGLESVVRLGGGSRLAADFVATSVISDRTCAAQHSSAGGGRD